MVVKVLGIETSCDETAIGIVAEGRHLLSDVMASQAEMHAAHGGIVPEIASRQHARHIVSVAELALEQAGLQWNEIDAVAVTHGPGLAGSLIVGVNAAKGIAASLELPFVGINHLEGHVYASWLEDTGGTGNAQAPPFPLMCLVTSGGHTDLVAMKGHGEFELIGRTRDDAAGEAFDKAARVLGLGFPGGPEIQRVARPGARAGALPRAWLGGSDDFSFSGLKTALLNRARKLDLYPPPAEGADAGLVSELAASFQEAVVDVLVAKTVAAAERHGSRAILLGGGVAANLLLREQMAARAPVPVIVPAPRLCTDNGSMVAACAWFRLTAGESSGWDLDVVPGLRLG